MNELKTSHNIVISFIVSRILVKPSFFWKLQGREMSISYIFLYLIMLVGHHRFWDGSTVFYLLIAVLGMVHEVRAHIVTCHLSGHLCCGMATSAKISWTMQFNKCSYRHMVSLWVCIGDGENVFGSLQPESWIFDR